MRDLAERLCGEGLGDMLASDGHRAAGWRPVGRLHAAMEALSVLVGRQRAEWMTYEAPTAIVRGVPVPDAPPIRPARDNRGNRRRSWRPIRLPKEKLWGRL